MFELPVEIIMVLNYFAASFTKPSFENAKLLLIGSLLCTGKRRISDILRIMGLGHDNLFCKYHRFFNRAKYNSCNLAKILLGLLVQLLPKDAPILIVVDDTVERRNGKKITAKGCYRDAIRSTEKEVVKCYGLKWVCMMLLVKLPWSKRHWALPVMTVLAPSKQANEKAGKTHRTVNDWTIVMVKIIGRWLNRSWVLIGDGAFACIKLAFQCKNINAILVSRLRLDAALFEFPPEPSSTKVGRPRTKGDRIKSLRELAKDESQPWETISVLWYGALEKQIRILTGVNLWYSSGEQPLPIRWVLVIDPETGKQEAFFSTELELAAKTIIEWFVLRWNIEVTFAESRQHLGFETQRQWSDLAIARTTPLLMGLFSLACLFTIEMIKKNALTILSTAWYDKNGEATFADIMAHLRRAIWTERYFNGSDFKGEVIEIPKVQAEEMLDQLCRAA